MLQAKKHYADSNPWFSVINSFLKLFNAHQLDLKFSIVQYPKYKLTFPVLLILTELLRITEIDLMRIQTTRAANFLSKIWKIPKDWKN
jgi:hypothetical protein